MPCDTPARLSCGLAGLHPADFADRVQLRALVLEAVAAFALAGWIERRGYFDVGRCAGSELCGKQPVGRLAVDLDSGYLRLDLFHIVYDVPFHRHE